MGNEGDFFAAGGAEWAIPGSATAAIPRPESFKKLRRLACMIL
jgi:hypothetical protein